MSKEKTAENKFGYTKGGKVYRKAFLDYPELEIGEVRESPDESLLYFEKRFETFEGKVDKLEEDIKTAANKGSFLMKLIHLKDKIKDFNGLGDFEKVLKKLKKIENGLNKTVEENRERNLDLKQKFLSEAETLANLPEEQLKDNLTQVVELKQKWVRTGAVKEPHQEEFENKFRDLINLFFERKRAYGDKKRLELAEKTKSYKFLIGRVNRLRFEPSKEAKEYEIEQVLKEWKTLPELPVKVRVALERKLFGRIKQLRDPHGGRHRSYDRSQGGSYSRQGPLDSELLKAKEGLLSEALELRTMELDQAVERAKSLQENWLKTGKSASPEVRTIYNKFREIIATIFERKTLEINVSKKFPDINKKSSSEKKILKISVMRDLIRKAKTDAKLFQENLQMAGDQEGDQGQNTLQSKLRNQKFKIRIRENLLREIEVN